MIFDEVPEVQDNSVQEAVAEMQQVAEQPLQQVRQESDQERNLSALRQKAERIQKERDDALRKLQEMQARKNDNVDLENVDNAPAPDELVEGKHLVKYHQRIKDLENKLNNYQQQSTEATAEARIKSQFPDFDKVVSQDNINTLRDVHPEIAETINSSKDLYSKAAAAYKLIKQFGIYQEDKYVAEREKAQQNANKPKPTASIGESGTPLSRANAFEKGLTDELKSQLQREMFEAMKNR